MKQFLLILIIILSSCSTHNEDTHVTIMGKVLGKIPERIEYTVPVKGTNYFGFENSVLPDSLGNFEISLSVDRASFIEFSNVFDSYGSIIAEPGMSYSVVINTEDNQNRFIVESENKEGQRLYNQIACRTMLIGEFEAEGKNYRNDSIPFQIKQRIWGKMEDELAGFKELLDFNHISEDFYKLVSTDRTYYYAGAQSSVALINYSLSQRKKNILNKEEYEILWKDVFQSYPISNPDLMRSPWFFYYLQSYVLYKELIENNTNAPPEISNIELPHTNKINTAKKYFSGEQFEYYYAAYISYETAYKNYEKELVSLFDQFKDAYPASEYSPFIESEIIPIIAFHEMQTEPLNENIHFVDNANNINSLKEAVVGLNANRVYVDVWATWCSPCKEEFQHNSKLYNLLKDKGVTMLYLSIDKENKNQQWMEMVKYYGLEGYHVRATEKLYLDLISLRGGSTFGIPWHTLTDGDGNMIQKDVSGPSEIENLEKQLSE